MPNETTKPRAGLTIGELCKLADVNERSAHRAIERLIALGLVEVVDDEDNQNEQ